MFRSFLSKLPVFSTGSSEISSVTVTPRVCSKRRPVSETRAIEVDENVIRLGPKKSTSLPSLLKMPSVQCDSRRNRSSANQSEGDEIPKSFNKKDKLYNFEISEQYELESARPKSNRIHGPFNIVDHINVPDKSFVLQHLQPSKMPPFGVRDQMYSPWHYLPKRPVPEELDEMDELEEQGERNNSNKKDSPVHRNYSTKSVYDKDYYYKLMHNSPGNKNKSFDMYSSSKQQQFDEIVSVAEQYNKILETKKMRFKMPKVNSHFVKSRASSSSDDRTQQHHDYEPKVSGKDVIYEEQEADVARPYYSQQTRRKPSSITSLRSFSSSESVYNIAKKPLSTSPPKNIRRMLNISTPLQKSKKDGRKFPHEPKNCEPEPETTKCFLPSKLRLKPPICTPKPPPCPKKPECIRADDCLEYKLKVLPRLIAKRCPCVPPPPMQDVPRLKRLNLRAEEPPRVCPPKPSCDCNTRADGCLVVVPRKLRPLKPGDCPCIPTPMKDAPPLKRLVCEEEEEECYPVDPCIDTPRADMGCWEYYIPPKPKKKAKKKNFEICPPYCRRFSTTEIGLRRKQTSSNSKSNKDCKVEKHCERMDKCHIPKYKHCIKSCEEKLERIPICCEKPEAPYQAFSDVLDPIEDPFEKRSHCNTCSKDFGFTPAKGKKLCKSSPKHTVVKGKKH